MYKHTSSHGRRTVLKTIGTSVVVTSAFTGVSAAQNTISVPGDETSIEDAIAVANPGDMIVVDSGVYQEAELRIDKNDLTLRGAGSDETTVESQSAGRGLTVEGNGVALEGVTLTEAGGYGFKLQFANDLNLHDISATNNGGTGIDLNKTDDPTLTGVESQHNGGAGIALRDLSGATIHGAVTRGNAWGGLGLWAPPGEALKDSAVMGSTITDEPAGVFVQYSGTYDAVSIEENQIVDNDVGIHIDDAFGEVVDVGEIVVHNNDIEDNDEYGVLNATVNDELDATDNWWGHASGPGGPDGRRNPAGREVGRGDDISGEVAFDPWLRRDSDNPSR